MMECNDMKAGNVAQQLDRLRNQISSLRGVANTLVDKVSPVLLEPMPTVKDGSVGAPTAPYQPLSPLYEELRVLEREVEEITTKLDDTIRRVDL